jgi:hypothetical protein
MTKYRIIVSALIFALLMQGCFQNQTVDSVPQTVAATPTVHRPLSTVTVAPPPTPTVVPTTEPLPTPTPHVTITAVNGNLYIRRGPGLPYDQIGVLYKGASAVIIGQDVLARWVQIHIPDSERTGWVSMMTDFSAIEGDVKSIPDFTFTDYPLPAYIKNCTEHDLWIEPGDFYLYNLFTNAQYLNEVQVNPGVYSVYDLFVPGEPEIQKVNIREGMTAYITVNGLGVSHLCP